MWYYRDMENKPATNPVAAPVGSGKTKWGQPILDAPIGVWQSGYDTLGEAENALYDFRIHDHLEDLCIVLVTGGPDEDAGCNTGGYAIYRHTGIDAAGEGHGPVCECSSCGCDEMATTTDDGGCPVCSECSTYTLDDDGEVVCSRDGVCAECGESRLSDALDAGGNSTVRLTGCACERAAALAEEDHNTHGEWAVVDMDGGIQSRHASASGARAAITHESHDFAAHLIDTHQASSQAYLPRSICHLACGAPVRAGQYSTSWYVPGCGCDPAEDAD